MSDFKHFHSVKNTLYFSQTEYERYLCITEHNGLSSPQQGFENCPVTEKLAQATEVGDKNFF